MADILNFYTDIDMKDIALSPAVGVAGVTGRLASLSNWNDVGQYTYDEGFYQKIYSQYVNASSGITLGGTGAIATIFSPNNWVTGGTPKLQDGNWKNCFFINAHDTSAFEGQHVWRGIYLQISGSQYKDNDDIWHFNPFIRIGNYKATPDNVISTKAERTSYKYFTGSDYEFAAEVSASGWTDTSQFNQIAMYSCTIEEKEFFMFVMGVNNGVLHPSNNAAVMLIPRSYFKYNIPKPYVGPVTPESAAGFDPPGREFYNDSIIPRVITDTNPFGFNEDDGWGTVRFIRQSKGEWVGMIQQIYHGIGSGLGALSQFVDVATFSPTTVRDAEEVSAMTKGILSCRVLPDFGFPVGAKVNESTICGYPLYKGYSAHKTIGNITDQIIPITFPQTYISRTYNNFLDFEPYTTATLHIPFVSDINIDPSVLYGSVISIEGYVDGFTGLISVDVVLRKNGVEWIYAELQGNCGTEMPIIGAGSTTSQAIGKVASGLGQLASNPVGGVFTMLDGIGKAGKSVPSTVNSNPQMAAYFAQRFCYITINTPLPENPENYAALMGTVVRKEGTVGQYAGYSEFSAVNLNTVTATDAEKQEIERLLKGGVFV